MVWGGKVKKNIFKKCGEKTKHNCSANSAIYGLGFIGALVYNFSVATGFWSGVLGFLKAIVWPALLVYKLMLFLSL